MRALIRRGTPATWAVADVPEPVRAPGEVLIDVVAAGRAADVAGKVVLLTGSSQ